MTTNKPLKILLVEDNDVNQQIMSRILSRQNHQVTLASNGQMALDAALQQPFDLILMDIEMPVMNGVKATYAIRQLPAYQNTPIIALTAHDDPNEVAQYFYGGMNDHLQKPIDVHQLTGVIARYFPDRIETSSQAQTTRNIDVLPETGKLMDFEALVETVGGKENFALHILQLFFKGADESKAELFAAIEQHDTATVKRLAHRIKGSMANARLIGGIDAMEALETMAQDLSFEKMQALYQTWQADMDAIHAEFMQKANQFMQKRQQKNQ